MENFTQHCIQVQDYTNALKGLLILHEQSGDAKYCLKICEVIVRMEEESLDGLFDYYFNMIGDLKSLSIGKWKVQKTDDMAQHALRGIQLVEERKGSDTDRMYFKRLFVEHLMCLDGKKMMGCSKVLYDMGEIEFQMYTLLRYIHGRVQKNNIDRSVVKMIKYCVSMSNETNEELKYYTWIIQVLSALVTGEHGGVEACLEKLKHTTLDVVEYEWPAYLRHRLLPDILKIHFQVHWDAQACLTNIAFVLNQDFSKELWWIDTYLDVLECKTTILLQRCRYNEAIDVIVQMQEHADQYQSKLANFTARQAAIRFRQCQIAHYVNDAKSMKAHFEHGLSLIQENQHHFSIHALAISQLPTIPTLNSVQDIQQDTPIPAIFSPNTTNPTLKPYTQQLLQSIQKPSSQWLQCIYLLSEYQEKLKASPTIDLIPPLQKVVVLASDTLRSNLLTAKGLLLLGQALVIDNQVEDAKAAYTQAIQIASHERDLVLQLHLLYCLSNLPSTTLDEQRIFTARYQKKALLLNKRCHDAKSHIHFQS